MCPTKSSILLSPDRLPIYLTILLCLVLTGCGFQLKGTDVSSIGTIAIKGSSSAPATVSALREALENRGIEIGGTNSSGYVLDILDERSSRRTVATTAVIDAANYELSIELDISVSRNGELLIGEAVLIAERVYAVDSVNLSGSFEEQAILIAEMRTELAQKVIRRLEAISLARVPSEAR
jgi:LPS-assembly lipoprotein